MRFPLHQAALSCALLYASSSLPLMAADKPLMKDFIGLNGHTINFKPDLYAPICRHVRDYHPVHWDLQEQTGTLPDWPAAKNGVNWNLYSDWKKKDWIIDGCLMFESIDRVHWKDLEKDAFAYGESFAKFFGPGGKKWIDTVEIGNEPGKWSDKDYETILKAMAGGVRKGDPKMKIATCNVMARPESGEYWKAAKLLKGYEEYYDILNIHLYAQLEYWPTWKRSYPEDPKLIDYTSELEKLIKWRDANAKGKPIWITEFGYDSSTKTAVPPSQWVGVTDTQQAQWLVRSIFVFAAMDVERAYIYFFDDADKPAFHSAAGLTRGFKPKPAFWAVAHLQKTLGEYRYVKTLTAASDKVIVHEYATPDSRKIAWVAWSPTGKEVKVKHVFRNAPGRLKKIERMPLEENENTTIKPEPKGNTLEMEVTESPTYLLFEK